jgi:hypothetical protein
MSPAEDDRRASLTAELTTALVRELALEWRRLNDSYFKSKLRLPQFLLTASTHTLGRYDYGQRVLSVSQALALEKPWSTVLEVLKHEMAHQYVFEILGVLDETAHGPAFREVCEKLGFDGRARGMPEAPEEPVAEARAGREPQQTRVGSGNERRSTTDAEVQPRALYQARESQPLPASRRRRSHRASH